MSNSSFNSAVVVNSAIALLCLIAYVCLLAFRVCPPNSCRFRFKYLVYRFPNIYMPRLKASR